MIHSLPRASNERDKLTKILRIDIPVPRDRGIDERSRCILVNEDGKVYGNLGPASASDVGREGSEPGSVSVSILT